MSPASRCEDGWWMVLWGDVLNWNPPSFSFKHTMTSARIPDCVRANCFIGNASKNSLAKTITMLVFCALGIESFLISSLML